MTGVGISEAAEEVDRRTSMGEMRNGPKIDLKQRGEVRAGPPWPGHPFDVSSVEVQIGILAAINFWQCGMRRIRWTR